ncbi:hypothetical protein QC761_0051580 [Podospora bellae-mahoneyi]|uniref:Uncharacterized protein n=1 Tax=Podospora bellae-mahoneyi TaxID=2093777 RepID=A0ABR0FKU6_9PEZI|nr:hypothetical protein QC761_0051580 [Podospora bellae-mahoneyi]
MPTNLHPEFSLWGTALPGVMPQAPLPSAASNQPTAPAKWRLEASVLGWQLSGRLPRLFVFGHTLPYPPKKKLKQGP